MGPLVPIYIRIITPTDTTLKLHYYRLVSENLISGLTIINNFLRLIDILKLYNSPNSAVCVIRHSMTKVQMKDSLVVEGRTGRDMNRTFNC